MTVGCAGAMHIEQEEEEGECLICLDRNPPPIQMRCACRKEFPLLFAEVRPIQSGCACRGAAGLAHQACRARAAKALVLRKGSTEWWRKCQTCHQNFTGPMRQGLADAWWQMVRDRAEVDTERLVSCCGCHVSCQLCLAEAMSCVMSGS